jgi:hypothetical protein
MLGLALLLFISMRAHGALANYLFASGLVAHEAAWDVGLAISLLLSTSLCFLVGVLAGCLGSWSFFKSSTNAT